MDLGNDGWLKPGRYRWLQVLTYMILLVALCVLTFNLVLGPIDFLD